MLLILVKMTIRVRNRRLQIQLIGSFISSIFLEKIKAKIKFLQRVNSRLKIQNNIDFKNWKINLILDQMLSIDSFTFNYSYKNESHPREKIVSFTKDFIVE